jgi:hypothetical protein
LFLKCVALQVIEESCCKAYIEEKRKSSLAMDGGGAAGACK